MYIGNCQRATVGLVLVVTKHVRNDDVNAALSYHYPNEKMEISGGRVRVSGFPEKC